MKQIILKLDDKYDSEEKKSDLENRLFDSLSTWNCRSSMSEELTPNQCFLLSCQLNPVQLEKIISNFPNGEISFSLQLSFRSNKSHQFFSRKHFSIRMSIFDQFTNGMLQNKL